MALNNDIVLDDNAFTNASEAMAKLKTRTENLKAELSRMYTELVEALNTPAGEAIEIEAKSVLIEPVERMLLVVEHISSTLDEIIGTGYYKDVFIKFEQLNQNIKFN